MKIYASRGDVTGNDGARVGIDHDGSDRWVAITRSLRAAETIAEYLRTAPAEVRRAAWRSAE